MRIRFVGSILLALVVGAFSAASASAHTWEFEGRPITGSPVAAEAYKNKVVLYVPEKSGEDTCTLTVKGTVGPGAAGTITSITGPSGEKAAPCSVVGRGETLCEGTAHWEAVNLPWATELTTINGKLKQTIKNGGKGTPGWSLKCGGIFGEQTEACGGTTNTGMVNNLPEGKVEAIFNGESPTLPCAGNKPLQFPSGVLKIAATKVGGTLKAT